MHTTLAAGLRFGRKTKVSKNKMQAHILQHGERMKNYCVDEKIQSSTLGSFSIPCCGIGENWNKETI